MTALPARAPADRPATRALFVNSGILGHRAVAGLLEDAIGLLPSVDAVHIDLSRDLTATDRILRRMFSLPLTPRTGAAGNLDLRRWREELNVGLLASRRIAEAGNRRPFDLLHFHTQAAAYASLGRMKLTPSIVSIDATQRLASGEATSSLARLSYQPNIVHDRHVFARAAAIVATSEWAARSLVADQPALAPKVHVMPYPVRCQSEGQWMRERSARPHQPVRVLFMGGDFPRKGGPDLLAAWREGGFADRASLDLVTDWPLNRGDIPPGVQRHQGVLPNSDEWKALWREADLFVMPTRHEAFGMVFQEAAAFGLPVVATNINAVPEIVQDGSTGILVARGEPGQLVGAMRTLIDSPDLRLRMGAAALARIRLVSSPDRYATRLESVIFSIVTPQVTQ